MNKFVAALTRLLGGLMAAAALALPMAARPQATPQEPIPYPIWTIEEVATGGYYHALALDSLDRPHLLYQDTETWSIHYATRDGDAVSPGEWQLADIVTNLDPVFGYSYDIAIQPDDTPCLVYALAPSVAPMDTMLVYGCRQAGQWHLTTIDDGGYGVQLAIDADGRPHVALVKDTSLIYLTIMNEQWWSETVATDSSHIGLISLTLDSAGRPHLVYRGGDGPFAAVLGSDGIWTKTPLPLQAFGAPRLDAADRLWMIVANLRDIGGHPPTYVGELYLARPDGGGHTLELVDDDLGPSYHIDYDLALDGEAPHLVYSNVGGDLRYVWWTDEGQQSESVGAYSDGWVSIAVGSDGQPRLAFSQDDTLRLATRRIVLLDESLALPFIAAGE